MNAIYTKGVDNVCMQSQTLTSDSLYKLIGCSVELDGEACTSCEICQNGFSTITDCSNINSDAVDTKCVTESTFDYQVLKFSATAECATDSGADAPAPISCVDAIGNSGAGAPNSGAGAYDYGIHFSHFVALASILEIHFW
jgi:hypothetical protein